MARFVKVYNETRNRQLDLQAKWCESYLCKLRGLTLRRSLAPGEALLLVESRDSVFGTTIHMMAVFLELGVIWINSAMEVVDAKIAKPWRIYAPQAPARYYLECLPSLLQQVQVGDNVRFEPA